MKTKTASRRQTKSPRARPSILRSRPPRLFARAAYYRAERRGFTPGGELSDWIEAERETLARLGGDEFGLLLENCPRALAPGTRPGVAGSGRRPCVQN